MIRIEDYTSLHSRDLLDNIRDLYAAYDYNDDKIVEYFKQLLSKPDDGTSWIEHFLKYYQTNEDDVISSFCPGYIFLFAPLPDYNNCVEDCHDCWNNSVTNRRKDEE